MKNAVTTIQKIMKERNIKQKDIVEYLGESQSAVSKWLSANEKIRNDIPNTVLLKIASFLKTSPYYLLGLEEEGISTSNNIIFLDKINLRAGAGAEGYADLPIETTKIGIDKSTIADIKGLDPKNLKVIEVIGDSMQPEYYEGDFAIIDMVNERKDFIKIEGIYIVRVHDVIYIKKVNFLPENKIRLISVNTQYGDIYPHKDGYEYEILGKVCGKIQFFKGLTFDYQGIK
ncbi:MAG: LexA family transcriptional regulator [Campylobacteraceae bacterium]|nr:LexA family transcriptional regulator [Campylobacteraceae bacterium]